MGLELLRNQHFLNIKYLPKPKSRKEKQSSTGIVGFSTKHFLVMVLSSTAK